MLLKRATKELREKGHPTLEVVRGVHGCYARDTRYRWQTGTPVRDTWKEVIHDVLVTGRLPINLRPLNTKPNEETEL